MKIFRKQEMQALEQSGEQSGITLAHMMEQAGRALAAEVEGQLPGLRGKRIAILCGSGNNSGDGYVCARVLAEKGADCAVLLTQGEPKTDLARTAFIQMPEGVTALCTEHQPSESEQALQSAACVVDCIFGFGFRGELRGDAARFLALANGLPCLRIAADIPSGAECDTGKVSKNTFQAHITVAFTAKKPAHCTYPAKSFCGEIHIAQTGIPPHLTDAAKAAQFEPDESFPRQVLPPGDVQANKGSFGRLLLICGSYGMVGAGIMAARGALRSGVGLLHIAIDSRAYPIAAQAVPEAIFTVLDFAGPAWQQELEAAMQSCSACVVGSGLGVLADKLCPLVFSHFADSPTPLLADADALNYAARTPGALEQVRGPLVITPHPGEMARLARLTIAQVQADRLTIAQQFASQSAAITVLKGAGTVITDGKQTAFNPTGNWGMAKGGSGDVLAGMTGAFLAQGIAPFSAAVLGAYLHGMAGDICQKRFTQRAMLPTDLPDALPEVWKRVE